MTPHQIHLIKSTWSNVVPIADTAATLFYGRLFEIDPSTRTLFRNSDMSEQRKKLVQALAYVVAGVDRFETLALTLADLGRRHVGYGVKDEHYASVGAALLWTLEQGLGATWTLEAHDAWAAAYGSITQAMQGGGANQGFPMIGQPRSGERAPSITQFQHTGETS